VIADFRDALAALVAHDVRFLVVGAHAPAAHGVPRVTGDLDIWVEPTMPNAADIHEVGKKLGVTTVLEGSVRKIGNRIRIAAQLVNVENGYQLWSATYDRQLERVFAVQDEISRTIVDALKLPRCGPSRGPRRTKPSAPHIHLIVECRRTGKRPQEPRNVERTGSRRRQPPGPLDQAPEASLRSPVAVWRRIRRSVRRRATGAERTPVRRHPLDDQVRLRDPDLERIAIGSHSCLVRIDFGLVRIEVGRRYATRDYQG